MEVDGLGAVQLLDVDWTLKSRLLKRFLGTSDSTGGLFLHFSGNIGSLG